MAKDNNTTVTIHGRLSFPVWTYKEALARNTTSPNPKKDEAVTPEFNLIVDQPQLDKYVRHVKDVFLPYCIAQSKAGEKRNALTEAEANRILTVLDSDWTEQPPYISVKPVPEKTAPLAPEVAGGLVRMVRACFDATYNHYPTELDRAARAAGIVQLSGIDLLVGQALDQIRLMTGRSCPPEPLLDAAYAALGGRG